MREASTSPLRYTSRNPRLLRTRCPHGGDCGHRSVARRRATRSRSPPVSKQLVTFEVAQFAVSTSQRTLTGMLLPFGVVSRPAMNPLTGRPALWTFDAETVEVP